MQELPPTKRYKIGDKFTIPKKSGWINSGYKFDQAIFHNEFEVVFISTFYILAKASGLEITLSDADYDKFPTIKIEDACAIIPKIIHFVPVNLPDNPTSWAGSSFDKIVQSAFTEGESWIQRNIRAYPYNSKLSSKINESKKVLEFFFEEISNGK